MPNHKEQATFYPKNYYSYENKKQAKKEQVNLIDMGMEILDFLFHLFEPKGYYIRDYKNSN
jgi:HJR/Mrr/RecB family endonuclease